jgi:hypothetical protein
MPDYNSAATTYSSKPNILVPASQAQADTFEGAAATRFNDDPSLWTAPAGLSSVGNGETALAFVPQSVYPY